MSHTHKCGKKEKTFWSRREFLMQSGGGVAGLALAHLLDRDGLLRRRSRQYRRIHQEIQ